MWKRAVFKVYYPRFILFCRIFILSVDGVVVFSFINFLFEFAILP